MTLATDGLATPLAASSVGARAEHCAPTCVLASDAATPLAASSVGARAEHCAPTCVLASDAASLVGTPPLVEQPRLFQEPREARVHSLSHGRSTLDELVSGAWAAVGAGAPAACPVCDGTLRRRAGGATAAECSRCGTELA